jgi:pyruvate/2-oxoglutarate dehydrogenase complex dihydrolipoamide dehydrogenase (E3) component
VTIIESGPQLLAREDIDVSLEIRRILGGEGIQVLVEAELLQVRGQSGDDVTLSVRTPSGQQYINGSDILVATGRIPNTSGIGLKEAGVELDGRGYIRVNGRLETSAPDVWAVGECAGSPQFTHISEDDFRIIRDNLAGGDRSTRALAFRSTFAKSDASQRRIGEHAIRNQPITSSSVLLGCRWILCSVHRPPIRGKAL